MARADLITSIVFMILGLAIAEESWRMPTYTDVGSSIWAAPGMVPGLLGLALTFMAAILLFRSIKARRGEGVPEGDADDVLPPEPGSRGRVALTLVLCLTYAGVLVGNMPFALATGLFTFVFIMIFELWGHPEAQRNWLRHAVVALIIAVIAGWLIAYVFSNIFFVRLP
ncbi:tripartite tricarboxylate transporter TctB family protein [Frigidibacter sp. ROC022]|uniref:tripartite tricarboxylate transporter TctB family protein n=1 Tax=Frigidibacter sp. ROC022 TaxID=2971796 RepID=UPI00215B0D59|nr:tripartite tricarboxylate transporter TctB family protein [Frigidibacter sp. ROC022]MCR8723174.1 tripartite tricarboxylate transporter TctB family protein [Frigidibacter sp. ROC022]